MTWGFQLINISSQFLSPKPHFRSGEPVCWAWPARTLDQAFFLLLSFLKVRSPVWALWIVLLACNPFSAVLLYEMTMSYTLEGTCVIGNASILVMSCSRTTFPVMLGRHWGLDLKQPCSRFCWPTLKGEALLLQLSRMVSSIVLVLTCFFTLFKPSWLLFTTCFLLNMVQRHLQLFRSCYWIPRKYLSSCISKYPNWVQYSLQLCSMMLSVTQAGCMKVCVCVCTCICIQIQSPFSPDADF